MIVSNPPYIPSRELQGLQPEVRCFEDAAALDGGSDGLDVVREVLNCARIVGLPGARIFLEVHHTHPAAFEAAAAGDADRNLIEALSVVETSSDLHGLPRFVELQVPFENKKTVNEQNWTGGTFHIRRAMNIGRGS